MSHAKFLAVAVLKASVKGIHNGTFGNSRRVCLEISERARLGISKDALGIRLERVEWLLKRVWK
jgi:hypothetical protein